MMKRIFLFSLLLAIAGLLVYLNFTTRGENVKGVIRTYVTSPSLVNESGMTVSTRIVVPEGSKRVMVPPTSFREYIQKYPLKNANAQVINYDGNPYVYQAGHIGVLEVSVPKNGLQQCADALMRLRAEYLWEQNRKNEIGFKFTSGHYCSWQKYAQGFRPKINGNKVTFSKTASVNNSKSNFYNYLNLIYTYAGTYSLAQELDTVERLKDVQIGDLLIYPGFPGHVIMVADICSDTQGKRYFAFLQGNTPAQSIHLIKNPNKAKISPWYDLEGKTSLKIPTYTFDTFRIVRFK